MPREWHVHRKSRRDDADLKGGRPAQQAEVCQNNRDPPTLATPTDP